MNKYKYVFALLTVLAFTVSCSLFNKLKEKSNTEKQETATDEKEKTVERYSQEDLKFYNTYIDVVNKISQNIERLHKSYLEDVPDPNTLRKNSMISAMSTEFAVGDLERMVKDYKRSYYENGELGKLNPDNAVMKKEIETEFRALLESLDGYYKTARKVMDYYKDKEYEKDLSPAAAYDNEMKDGYEKYKSAFDRLNDAVKKYKPKREQRDLGKISNPDEKAVAALMNAYENTLDKAENIYGGLEKIENNGEVTQLLKDIDEFEKGFESEKSIVQSVTYSDRTKYMKYSFEDYFSKTVGDFVKEARKFLNTANGKKMKEQDFNRGYDYVISYYNYMINAYNSSISALNSFRIY